MCGQQNVRITARDNTGQNTDKGHTLSPRIEMKISELYRNRTRAAREGSQGLQQSRHGEGQPVTLLVRIRNIIMNAE